MSIIEKINIESGSIASPSIIFRETTTGLSAYGGDLCLSMGGVEKLKLSNAGILSLPGYSGNNGKYLKMDASGVLSADTPAGGATGSEAVYSGFAVKQDGLESATTSVYASKINKNITLFFAAKQVNLSATTNTIKSRIFPNDALYPNMSYNYSKSVYINNKLAYARFVQNINEYYLEFFTFPTLAWDAGTPFTMPFTITYVGANNTALTGATWGTTYFDAVVPTISGLSPSLNEIDVAQNRDYIITFSENIYRGLSGSVTIKVVGGADLTIFDILNTNLIFSGATLTIPAQAIVTNTNYCILISAGAVIDSAGNPFAEITSEAVWSFYSYAPPIITSLNPNNGAINVVNDTDLVVTFNEPIQAGLGNIFIKIFNGNPIETISIADPKCSILNNVLTINPASTLVDNTEYEILMDAGVVKDAAGNNHSGISTGSWKFTCLGITNLSTPILTSNTSNANFLVTASSMYDATHFIWHLFDDNKSAYWTPVSGSYDTTTGLATSANSFNPGSGLVSGAWFRIVLNKQYRFNYYRLSQKNVSYLNLSNFVLYGSNDNATFTSISSVTNYNLVGTLGVWNPPISTGLQTYRYIVFQITKTSVPTSGFSWFDMHNFDIGYGAPVITAFSIPSLITTSGEIRTVTITFSENVYNFTIADLTPTGGTLGPLSGSGNSYSVVFTSNSTGTCTLQISGQYTNIGGIVGPGKILQLTYYHSSTPLALGSTLNGFTQVGLKYPPNWAYTTDQQNDNIQGKSTWGTIYSTNSAWGIKYEDAVPGWTEMILVTRNLINLSAWKGAGVTGKKWIHFSRLTETQVVTNQPGLINITILSSWNSSVSFSGSMFGRSGSPEDPFIGTASDGKSNGFTDIYYGEYVGIANDALLVSGNGIEIWIR